MQNNHLSLEMSKKINFKGKTEMYWCQSKTGDRDILANKDNTPDEKADHYWNYYKAPNIAELADVLKEHIESIRTDKYVENWEITIYEKEVTFSNYFKSTVFSHPHLVEALGIAYQKLTELGIIK